MNDNQLLSAPHIGYNPATAIKNCPGTLGISAEGKAEISYAEVFDNVLYKFSNGGTNKQVSNGTPWTPVTAVSGYSYPLQGGSVMIGAEINRHIRLLLQMKEGILQYETLLCRAISMEVIRGYQTALYLL